MEKFTKGEWKVKLSESVNGVGVVSIFNKHGFVCSSNVIKVSDDLMEGESWLDMRKRTEGDRVLAAIESNANAYLMAAAPEMYGLLGRLSEFLNDDGITGSNVDALNHELSKVKGLLAKARGE